MSKRKLTDMKHAATLKKARNGNAIVRISKTCTICTEDKPDSMDRCHICKDKPICGECYKTWLLTNPERDLSNALKFKCPTCRTLLDVPPSVIDDEDVSSMLLDMFMEMIWNANEGYLKNMLFHYPWLGTRKTINNSPMHIAAAIKDIPIMVLLEKHGASMFDALENGCMPIHMCMCHGADDSDDDLEETEMIFTAIHDGEDDIVRGLMLEDHNIMNHRSEVTGIPVSHYVAKHGSEELQLEVFSNPNTDVNMLYEEYPLHIFPDLPIETFKTIINRSEYEHVNYVHEYGYTDLIRSLKWSSSNDVFLDRAVALINHPMIDLTLKDRDDKTALDVAREKQLSDMVHLIESKLRAME